jgi:L-aspartate oxidase
LTRDLIPVAPAAHYFIGGVAADMEGVTSLPGLLALGEASATGVHGANRLASNSLLEGLVFGMAAADRLRREWPRVAAGDFGHRTSDVGPELSEARFTGHPAAPATRHPVPTGEIAALRVRLRRAMSRDVGVVRDAAGLTRARAEIEAIATALGEGGAPAAGSSSPEDRRAFWELRNLVAAARAVIAAALHREESRGAHYRSDFPQADPALDGRHTLLGGDGRPRYGALADAFAKAIS